MTLASSRRQLPTVYPLLCQGLNANKHHRHFSHQVVDSFTNIETVQLYNGHHTEETKISKALQEKEQADQHCHMQSERIGFLQLRIVGMGFTVLTLVLLSYISNKTMEISDLILVHTYLLQLTLPLSYFGFACISIQKGVVTMHQVREIFKQEEAQVELSKSSH